MTESVCIEWHETWHEKKVWVSRASTNTFFALMSIYYSLYTQDDEILVMSAILAQSLELKKK